MASAWQPRAIAFFALAAAGALVWTVRISGASADAPIAASHVPTALGAWHGQPLPLDQKVFDILETQDVVVLEYHRRAGESPVWLSQVAGFGNRAAFHPPELCYVGSHYEVLERGPITVTAAGAPRQLMRLVIAQNQEKFEAWYWFTAGNRITSNYYRQQLWLVWDQLRGKPSSGTLVRISTIADQSTASSNRLKEFLEAFLAS